MPSPAYGEIQQPLKVLQNRYSNNVASTLLPYTKINSKWLKDLNVRHDTIKLLKEYIGKTFSNINCINVFLRLLSQGDRNKNENKLMDLIKLLSFCSAKEIMNKMKRQPTAWEKIFANDATNKGLISKTNKQLLQFNNKNKQTNNPSEKWKNT